MRIPGSYSKAPRLRHAVARTSSGTTLGTILGTGLGDLSGKPPLSPRCGRPMARYETAGGPAVLMDEEPACGRPEGHHGPCRSAAAVARYYAADMARIAEIRRVRGRNYGRPKLARRTAA